MVVYDKFFGSEWYKWSFPVLDDDRTAWNQTANSSCNLTTTIARGLYKVPNPALSQSLPSSPTNTQQQNKNRSSAPPPTVSLMDEFLPWHHRDVTRPTKASSSRYESIPGSRQINFAPNVSHGRHQTCSSESLAGLQYQVRPASHHDPRRHLPQRRQSRHFMLRQSLMPPGYTEQIHPQAATPNAWAHVNSYHIHPQGNTFNVYPQGSTLNVHPQGSTLNVHSPGVSIRQHHPDTNLNVQFMTSDIHQRAFNYHSYSRGLPSNVLQQGFNYAKNAGNIAPGVQQHSNNYIQCPGEIIVSNHHPLMSSYNCNPIITEIPPKRNGYMPSKTIHAVSESTSLDILDHQSLPHIRPRVDQTSKCILPLHLDGISEGQRLGTPCPLSAVSEDMVMGVKSLMQIIPKVYRKVVDFFTTKEDTQVRLWSTMKPSHTDPPMTQKQTVQPPLHGHVMSLNLEYASSDYDSYRTQDTTTTCSMCAALKKSTGTISTQTEPLSMNLSVTNFRSDTPKDNKTGVVHQGFSPESRPITQRGCRKKRNRKENITLDSSLYSPEPMSTPPSAKNEESKETDNTLPTKKGLSEQMRKRMIPLQRSKTGITIEPQTKGKNMQQALSMSSPGSHGPKSADTSVRVSDLDITPNSYSFDLSPGSSEYTTPMGSPLRRQNSPKLLSTLILRGSPGTWSVAQGPQRVRSFVDVKKRGKGQSPKRSSSAAGLAKRKTPTASWKMPFPMRKKKKTKDMPRKVQKRAGPLRKVPTFVKSVREAPSSSSIVSQAIPSKTGSNHSCISTVSLKFPPVRKQNPIVKKLKGPQPNTMHQLKQVPSTSSIKSLAIPCQVPSNCSCISSMSVKSKSIWTAPTKQGLPHKMSGKFNCISRTANKKDLGLLGLVNNNISTGKNKTSEGLFTKTNVQNVKRTTTSLLQLAENQVNKKDIEMLEHAKNKPTTSLNSDPLTKNNKNRTQRLTARSLSLLGTKQNNKNDVGLLAVIKDVSSTSANKDSCDLAAVKDTISTFSPAPLSDVESNQGNKNDVRISKREQKTSANKACCDLVAIQDTTSTFPPTPLSHIESNQENKNDVRILNREQNTIRKCSKAVVNNNDDNTRDLEGKQEKMTLDNVSSGSLMEVQDEPALNSNMKYVCGSSEDSLSNSSTEQFKNKYTDGENMYDQNESIKDDDSKLLTSSIMQSRSPSMSKDVFKTIKPPPNFDINKSQKNVQDEEKKTIAKQSPVVELDGITQADPHPPLSLNQEKTEELFQSLMIQNEENSTKFNNAEPNLVESPEQLLKPAPARLDPNPTHQSNMIGDSTALINTSFVTNLTSTATSVSENKKRPLIAPAKFVFQPIKTSEDVNMPAAVKSESNSTTEWSNSTAKHTETASSSDEQIDKHVLSSIGKQLEQMYAGVTGAEGVPSDSQSNASNASKTSINRSIRNLAKTSARTKKVRTATRKEDLPPTGKSSRLPNSRPNSTSTPESDQHAYTGQSPPPEVRTQNAVISTSKLKGKSPTFHTEKLKKLEMTKYIGIVQDSEVITSKDKVDKRTSPRTKKRKDSMPNSEEMCKQRKKNINKKPRSVPVLQRNLPSPIRSGSKKTSSLPLPDRKYAFSPIDKSNTSNSKCVDIKPIGPLFKTRTTKISKRPSTKDSISSVKYDPKKVRHESTANDTTHRTVSSLRGMFESSGLKPAPEKNPRGKKLPAKSISKDSLNRFRISTKRTVSDSNVSSVSSIQEQDKDGTSHVADRPKPENDSKLNLPKPRRSLMKATRTKDPDSFNYSACSSSSQKPDPEGRQKRSSSANKSQVPSKKTVNLTRSLSNAHVKSQQPVSLSARRFVSVQDKPTDPPLAQTLYQADPVLNPSPTSSKWQYAYFCDPSAPTPPRP